MKRAWVVLIGMALMLVGAGASLSGQEQASTTHVFFGPVLGVETVRISRFDFDSTMQDIFPDSKGAYYPVYSEIGVESAQFFPLGDTRSFVAIHELFMISGLDQHMPVPNLDLLFGFRAGFGLEVGVGPHFTLVAPGGSVKIGSSLMYWVGWWFSFHGFALPVKLTFVPLPSYAKPTISLLFGVSFEGL